jgi:xanthine dehydrogenase YagR molybdenum-binding subunit
MATESRTQKYPVGIAGVSLSEVERQVPADEAPPLPPNDKLRYIGKPVPRINGRAKVTGRATYTVDVKLPGMLHGRMLRSPYPHARVLSIDTKAAERRPGVRAVQLIERPSGRAIETADGPRERRTLYVGEPIAAVAAATPQEAQVALQAINVAYQPLPFVVDIEDARMPDAPRVFEHPVMGGGFGGGGQTAAGVSQQGNVRGPNTGGSRGDVAAGFAQAEVVVEGEYRTQVQTHSCMETHAVVADWRKGGVTVYMSTQYTAGIRAQLASAFRLPLGRVRVIVDVMGGGFGSKSSASTYVLAAVALSRKAKAPVRLVLDRHEEQLDSGNRPATVQRIKVGARRDGTLTAVSVDTYGTSGVAVGAGVGNFAQSIYICPNFSMAQSDVFINAGPGCAMRGPGNTPGAFAYEQVIDDLAEKLKLDPVVLRDRIDPSPARREERRIGVAAFGWQRRRAPNSDTGPVKRGVGMAQSLWGANVNLNASCEVRIFRDGSVEVLSSVQDIGTGVGTILAQVVAEELGLKPQDIIIRIGDTDFPAGPPSYGSMTTASITPPTRNAARQALLKLVALAAPPFRGDADRLVARDGRIASADGSFSMGFREAAAKLNADQISATATRSDDYGGFGHRFGQHAGARHGLGGVQFAEVTVDTETGRVRVERVVAVQDCGRPMNPLQIESQVQGGILQGISYALYEDRIIDRHTGHMLNPNLEQYKVLHVRETPQVEVHLIENYQGTSATDAYGIAEPANIPTAPAVANAVYNAIGVRMHTLPMTPAAILAALGRVPHRS